MIPGFSAAAGHIEAARLSVGVRHRNDFEFSGLDDSRKRQAQPPGRKKLHLNEIGREGVDHFLCERLGEFVVFEKTTYGVIGLNVDLSPTRHLDRLVRGTFNGADAEFGRDSTLAFEIEIDAGGAAIILQRQGHGLFR